jgi:hypothetical protein
MADEKHTKRERERLAEANQPLPIRERLRNQWDVLSFERRQLEWMDQSVRYALVIFTTVNAFAAILLTRADILFPLSPSTLLVTRVLAAVYGVLTVTILLIAVRSLRPGHSPADLTSLSAAPADEHGAKPLRVLQTLMPAGVDHARLAVLHDSWRTISGEELSGELTQACIVLRSLVETKYHALRRLYTGLAVMLSLAAILGIGLALASIA